MSNLETCWTNAKLYENREGWRLIGMLKKMLDDNNIDVVAKMKEWRK